MDDVALSRCDRSPDETSVWPRALLAILMLYAGTGVAANAPLDATGPAPDVGESLFATPTTHDHIGRVVVPVRINGRGPYRFIVDTGANHSTISPDLVRQLGLTPGAEDAVILDGITGSSQVAYVSIDELQAGALTIQETALPVVWAPVMAGADGILGAAGLADKSLLIDFKRNRVAISTRLDSSARTDSTKIHATRVANGLLVIDALVGNIRVEAVLDTGSERTLGNLALRDALKAHGRETRGFVAQVTSVYGATTAVEPGEIRAAPPISIDTLHITDVAVVYGGFHIFKVWNMDTRPALILGMDVLGTVTSLNIDFRNNVVYVGSAHENNSDVLQGYRGMLSDPALKR